MKFRAFHGITTAIHLAYDLEKIHARTVIINQLEKTSKTKNLVAHFIGFLKLMMLNKLYQKTCANISDKSVKNGESQICFRVVGFLIQSVSEINKKCHKFKDLRNQVVRRTNTVKSV